MSKLGSKLGPAARSILAAGRAGDDPTPADRARVKRALMRSIAATTALGATSAASAAGGGAVTAGGAAVTSTGLGIKLLGGVVLAFAVGAGVLVHRVSTPEQPSMKAAPITAAPAMADRVHAPSATVNSATPAPANAVDAAPVGPPSEPAPGEKVPGGAPSARATAREPVNHPELTRRSNEEETNLQAPAQVTPPGPGAIPVLEEDPLAVETRRLREAHGALQAGDPEKALTLLGEQGGQLGQERAAARVLALCQMGRVAEAEAAGAIFLREHPRSPLADRIRGGCAPSNPR